MNVPELKAKARPAELQWPGALTRALVVSAQDRTARVPRNASNPELVHPHHRCGSRRRVAVSCTCKSSSDACLLLLVLFVIANIVVNVDLLVIQ